MIRGEETEKAFEEANNNLQQVRSNLLNQNHDLTREGDLLHKDLERLNSERNAVVDDLSETSIGIYNNLRKQKHGIAVTSMTENSCSACGTTLTQSQHQNARSTDQFFFCPTCGRIVYAS
jgi:predicted  nucleic acid-binding Zn-ribbon protein